METRGPIWKGEECRTFLGVLLLGVRANGFQQVTLRSSERVLRHGPCAEGVRRIILNLDQGFSRLEPDCARFGNQSKRGFLPDTPRQEHSHQPMSTPPRGIHVRLFRGRCWEVFERKGVEPFYLEKVQAVYYAQRRGRLGNATVRIHDDQGQVERGITPPAEEQMLLLPEQALAACFFARNSCR